MDSKKFLQLVEEKKKKALQKNQARLEWELKLEAAAKVISEAKARERQEKRVNRKHKKRDASYVSDELDVDRKSRRRHKKRRALECDSDSSDESDEQKAHRRHKKRRRRPLESESEERDSEIERRPHRQHRRKGSASDVSSSDSDCEGHRLETTHRQKRMRSSSRDLSDYRQDGETGKRVAHRKRHHKRRESESEVSDFSDGRKKTLIRHKRRSTDYDSSDSHNFERGERRHRHHGKKDRIHSRKHRREEQGEGEAAEEYSDLCDERRRDYKHQWSDSYQHAKHRSSDEELKGRRNSTEDSNYEEEHVHYHYSDHVPLVANGADSNNVF